MKDLLILGTSAHAYEMIDIIERVNRQVNGSDSYRLIGFVATDHQFEKRPGMTVYPLEALDENLQDAALVPLHSIDIELKLKYRNRMITLIDPSCFVSRSANIGCGCVLYPDCFVGHQAVIHDFVFCLSGCKINHDDAIGMATTMASGVMIAGHVTIQREAYLGQGCTINGGIEIGEKSLIGTGAVVTKSVLPDAVMVGNPARILRFRLEQKGDAKSSQEQ